MIGPTNLNVKGVPGWNGGNERLASFLGKPGAGNHGDCEIQQALLQRLLQHHAPLGRKRSIHAVSLQFRHVACAIAAGERSLDPVERERRNRGGAGSDPFDYEVLDFNLHGPFPFEGSGGALCTVPSMHEIPLDCPSAHVGFQDCRKIHLLEMAIDGNRAL